MRSLRQVAETLDLNVGEVHEATIGGHLIETIGRVPEEGEHVTIAGREFQVTRTAETQVVELRTSAEPELQ